MKPAAWVGGWGVAWGMAVVLGIPGTTSAGPPALAPGVRGLITRAPKTIKVDGNLDGWAGAFCTPVHYNHRDLANRAAQFFYLWDDQAFYLGLRALDQKRANNAPLPGIANGDAVEFYFDTRRGSAFRSRDWGPGAIHMFLTAFEHDRIKPRWVVRQGIATSNIQLQGVELAARNTPWGYELAFKLPWKNFPQFQPRLGAVVGLDVELCSSDGGPRVDRTFAYGSPLSVQQPASQAAVQLVERVEDADLPQVAAALFPVWVDTPWEQPGRAEDVAVMAIPPLMIGRVARVEARLMDLHGKLLRAIPAPIEQFGPPGFVRARAVWSIDAFAPGTYFAAMRAIGANNVELATSGPRMVQEAQMEGR